MKLSEQDKRVIKQYEKEEEMMVLIFAQWCINHCFDPVELYKEAYPDQGMNKKLEQAMKQTTGREESADISTAAVLHVLQEFGNDDLAFVVAEKAKQLLN